MKRFTIIIMSMLMLFSIVGCSEKNISTADNINSSSAIETSQSITETINPDSSPDYDKCLNYIKENAVDPSDYVINKLKEHDIVILGESHGMKDNLDFISENISKLYHEGGVRIFASEFVRSHNNEVINEIVTAKEFDYEAVVDIYRDFAWLWGYKGYIDIIESIWKLNNSLSEYEEKLKIVGLDYEWWDWSGAKAEGNEAERDKYMADMFINSYGIISSDKAIIHMGFNHSFWDFINYGNRTGYYLYQTYGDKIFNICMHFNYYINDIELTKDDFYITNFIDDIYRSNDSKSIGFDIIGSPFENMKDNVSDYFLHNDDTVFGNIAKGYIIFKDIPNIKTTPFIDNFINESNFEKAKELTRKDGWFEFDDNISIYEFNQKLNDLMNR